MFNGKEGKAIDLNTATQYTANYRSSNPGAIKGFFMGKDILEQLIRQSGAQGIRVYYGEDNAGELKMVFVAADTNEADMTGLVADAGEPCPTRCTQSVLNT